MNDGRYAYADPTCDESIMHAIEPSLTYLRPMLISKINVIITGQQQAKQMGSL